MSSVPEMPLSPRQPWSGLYRRLRCISLNGTTPNEISPFPSACSGSGLLNSPSSGRREAIARAQDRVQAWIFNPDSARSLQCGHKLRRVLHCNLSSPYRILRQQAHKLRSQLQSTDAAPSRQDLLAILDQLENLALRLEEEQIERIQWRKKLEHNQRVMDMHVAAIEESLIFRLLRRLGPLLAWKARAGQALLHSPFHGLYLKMRPPGKDTAYALWVDQEVASRPAAEWYRCRANEFSYRPIFSVLLPVHAPPREWLEQGVQSVLNQTYPHWELCVCDDASECWVREYFHKIMQDEAKIRFVHSAEHLGISGTLNRALSLATGDYYAFLDQDDVLSPSALHHIAESLQEGPAALLYTDEDFIDEERRRIHPLFKPDWSPNLLLSCMYLDRK